MAPHFPNGIRCLLRLVLQRRGGTLRFHGEMLAQRTAEYSCKDDHGNYLDVEAEICGMPEQVIELGLEPSFPQQIKHAPRIQSGGFVFYQGEEPAECFWDVSAGRPAWRPRVGNLGMGYDRRIVVAMREHRYRLRQRVHAHTPHDRSHSTPARGQCLRHLAKFGQVLRLFAFRPFGYHKPIGPRAYQPITKRGIKPRAII